MMRWLWIFAASACLSGCASIRTDAPDWVTGKSAKYPDSRFLIGRGQADSLEDARNRARADLAKMLVHRRARRQGLGERLMRAAEDTARACDKTLLVLDTVSGGDAERLYARLGWQRVGVIPDYALWPQGGLCATTVFYRRL